LIKSAGNGDLSPDEQRLLARPRSEYLRDIPWTDADVALVDEADAILGPVEAARPRRSARRRSEQREAVETAENVVRELGLGQYTTAAQLAARFEDPAAIAAEEIPELRRFGHILVDEAQDLSPMQWRMLARRAPNGSMTLVGDFGQASRSGAAREWDDVLAQLPRFEPPRHVDLTVNYRTPSEIMDVANRLLAVAAPHVAPTRSVRVTGVQPRFDRVEDPVVAAEARARAAVAAGGTVAVIAPPDLRPALAAVLADLGAVADAADALDAPVGVIGPTDAKGLEFDHVIVVEPGALVRPDPAGLRLLYVALTRATQTLDVVHAGPLPEALAP
jgi:superfamily I DNA/RNA helicase